MTQTPEVSNVYMFILMRTDMKSMNAGKAVAQGAHGANACVGAARRSENTALKELLVEWETQTPQDCGTTLTFGVNEKQMRTAVATAQGLGLHAGIFHDPTYPLVDGEVCHLIPLDTCGYILARKPDAQPAVFGLDLMP